LSDRAPQLQGAVHLSFVPSLWDRRRVSAVQRLRSVDRNRRVSDCCGKAAGALRRRQRGRLLPRHCAVDAGGLLRPNSVGRPLSRAAKRSYRPVAGIRGDDRNAPKLPFTLRSGPPGRVSTRRRCYVPRCLAKYKSKPSTASHASLNKPAAPNALRLK